MRQPSVYEPVHFLNFDLKGTVQTGTLENQSIQVLKFITDIMLTDGFQEYYPNRILADKVYRNCEDLSYCKLHGVRLSAPALGRAKKVRLRTRLSISGMNGEGLKQSAGPVRQSANVGCMAGYPQKTAGGCCLYDCHVRFETEASQDSECYFALLTCLQAFSHPTKNEPLFSVSTITVLTIDHGSVADMSAFTLFLLS